MSQASGGEAPEGASGQTLAGVFAALLDRAHGEAADKSDLAGLPGLIDGEPQDPAATGLRTVIEAFLPKAAVTEAAVASFTEEIQVEPAEVIGALVDLLAALETAIDAGETPDPKLLEKLGKALEVVGAILQAPIVPVQPTTAATLGDNVALSAAEVPALPVAATLSLRDGPVALPHQALTLKLTALAARLAERNIPAAEKLTALAEKLGSMKEALADVLAARPELKAAIEQLVAAKAGTKPVEPPPAFATAELRLPETPSLSARKAPPASVPTPSSAVEGEEPVVLDVEDAQPRLTQPTNGGGEPRAAIAVGEKPEAPSPVAPAATPAPAGSVPDTTVAVPAQTHTTMPALDGGTARAVHAAYAAPSAINLPHMAFEIARQVQQGVSKFHIRLDPPELGRVDVKLDMDAAGQVNAKLTVERAETLDLLQRDQRALERALVQAGLDASKTNLEFSLKQNPFAQQDGKGQQTAGSPFADGRASVLAEVEPAVTTTVYRGTASPGGVNIFV